MRALELAVEEDAQNTRREKDEETRRLAAAKAERIARSDVWCYVLSGAGSAELNGTFHRDGNAVRNPAWEIRISIFQTRASPHSTHSSGPQTGRSRIQYGVCQTQAEAELHLLLAPDGTGYTICQT